MLSESLTVEDEIESRSIANFTIIDFKNEHDFKKGMPVYVYDGELESKVFRGYIEEADKIPAIGLEGFYWRIQCVDMHYLADKRRVTFVEKDENAGNIAKKIVDGYLEEEGATYVMGDTIELGPTIKEIRVSYQKASKILDELAERAGFWWKIDEDKVLYFLPYEAKVAPIQLTQSNIVGKPELKIGNNLYRNIQYVKGSKALTAEQTEIESGDGEKRSFTVGFDIAQEPEIAVDSGEGFEIKTVGRKGVDIESDWFWGKGDKTVRQNDDEPVLQSAHLIRIKYVGEFDIVARSQVSEEILHQKEIEVDTSGKVEDSIEAQIEGRLAAIEKANSKLSKYAKNSTTLSFRTRNTQLETGMLLTVNIPELNLNNVDLLITNITTTSEIHEQTQNFDDKAKTFYDVKAVRGPKHTTWSDLFNSLEDKSELFIREGIGEEEVLTILIELDKIWDENERPNIFHEKFPSETLLPSENIYPMFNPGERILYMAWFENDTELGRKHFTQQTGTETDEIFTLTFLNPNEANENITHFAWYGGFRATSELGTGVEVDKQVNPEGEKTEMESFQVEKTDRKWS